MLVASTTASTTMGKADLHLHTRVSDGMATVEQVVEYAEHQTGMDVIAVTDHEDVAGGLRARELAAKRNYRVQVVPGVEVTTLNGHIIALFVETAPKSFRRVESTLEMIHTLDGLAIIPHPMSWLTRSLSRRTIDRITERGEEGVAFDGIETGNPSPAGRLTGALARHLNARIWRLAEVGGSDAHHLAHVGTGWTEFEGCTTGDLATAIRAASTRPGMSSYPSSREVGYGQLAIGLAWGYTATPRKMLRRKKGEGDS
ncbi:MAG: phosphotransferase [Anaerolinea sp.]|nr:phosphotransferase [Anaerolinea sp.]